jgi:hypothetical protein
LDDVVVRFGGFQIEQMVAANLPAEDEEQETGDHTKSEIVI